MSPVDVDTAAEGGDMTASLTSSSRVCSASRTKSASAEGTPEPGADPPAESALRGVSIAAADCPLPIQDIAAASTSGQVLRMESGPEEKPCI
mmetsp:Transcript_14461/g.32249  ORF Transcript_14461/g.32249 Transcript_14461/m.32249 type:complete len:92 (-) Transcript_14461:30-305(-)